MCHNVVVIYRRSLQIPTKERHILGMVHVFLMHLILECSEEGSAQTVYRPRLEHIFQLPRLPLGYTDEAMERDLGLGKRFAGLSSTVVDKSIGETLGHEMYVTFLGRRVRRSKVHFWHPQRCGVVMEQCVVRASSMLRVVF